MQILSLFTVFVSWGILGQILSLFAIFTVFWGILGLLCPVFGCNADLVGIYGICVLLGYSGVALVMGCDADLDVECIHFHVSL